MLHREYFDEFLELYDDEDDLRIEQIIMGVHFKDEEWFSRYDENADGLYEVVHVPDKYSMGEEKTLIKNIFTKTRRSGYCAGSSCPTATSALASRSTPGTSSTTRRRC